MTTETAETTEEATAEATDAQSDAAAAEAKHARHEQLKDRLLLPLLLPVLCIAFIVLLAINISRLFLAGGHGDSLWVVVGITILLLVGFAAVSAARNMRNVTSLILLGVVVGGLLVAGGITFSAGQPEKVAAVKFGAVPEGYTGPISPLRVEALPTLKFNAETYNAPAGALDIAYYDAGGQHTFVFSDARYSWFQLAVNAQGETATGKIRLEAGTYEFYCSVPGHKQAGMVANIIVK
jgi:plastocyanin